MKAYKFRSADQASFIFDILLNKRLFCSDVNMLNDVVEGVSVYSSRNDHNDSIVQIEAAKHQYRICSLSETYDCHLLWAHYANGFSGVAIELELPDDNEMIRKVHYDRGVFAGVNINDTAKNYDEIAKNILFSKNQVWKYEKEIRILHTEPFFNDVKVTGVIAGCKMQPALFDALNIFCQHLGIRFSRIGIGDEGMDMDYVEPKNFNQLAAKEH